jgi:hypothetical protein
MLWVIIFAAIAVAGLVLLVCYGVWLAHKTADVLSEVTVLAERGGQLAELLGRIQPPATTRGLGDTRDLVAVDDIGDPTRIDVR